VISRLVPLLGNVFDNCTGSPGTGFNVQVRRPERRTFTTIEYDAGWAEKYTDEGKSQGRYRGTSTKNCGQSDSSAATGSGRDFRETAIMAAKQHVFVVGSFSTTVYF
jgi:hypothetical protein